MSSKTRLGLGVVCWVASAVTVLAQAAPAELGAALGNVAPARAIADWIDDYAALPVLDRTRLDAPYRAAIFARVQLRTETDRLSPDRQRYSVRAEPILPYLRRAERDMQAAQRAAIPVADERARREAAAEALALLFAGVGARRELSLLDAAIGLHDTLAQLTRLRLAEPGFEVERVLDVEDDRSDLLAARTGLTGRLAMLAMPTAMDYARFVSAADALALAPQLLALGVRPDGALDAELALLDAAVALERAENWKVIDFVQLDYRSDLPETGDRYSVGMGVRLPRSRVRKLDELAVERVEEVQRARLADREAERDLAAAYRRMQTTAAELEALRAAVLDRSARRANLATALRASAETRPDDLLRIRRRDLRDGLDVVRLEAELLEDYARLVGRSGWVDVAGIARWVVTE